MRSKPTDPNAARPDQANLVSLSKRKNSSILHLGPRPIAPLFIDVPDGAEAQAAALAASAGTPLYRIRAVSLGWFGPKTYDVEPLLARLARLIASDPNARLLLEISLDAPAWWLEAHPQEAAEYALEGAPATVSFASTRWIREAGAALENLIAQVRNSPFADALVGAQLNCGLGGGWVYPAPDLHPDTGQRMLERYHQFAMDKYRGNPGLLQIGWDDPRANFYFKCPDALERQASDLGLIRNTRRFRRLLDYYECLNNARNEALLALCHTAKQATRGRLVGIGANGPFLDSSAASGAALPEGILDSTDWDFVVTRLAPGDAVPAFPAGSAALHGKWILLADQGAAGVAAAATHRCGVSVAPSLAEAEAKVAMSMLKPWEGAGALRNQACVMIDPAGAFYVNCGRPEGEAVYRALTEGQLEELALMGAPFDLYFASDLFSKALPAYPLTLFLNTIYLSRSERRNVDAHVKHGGQTAVWFWGAGLVGEDGTGGDPAMGVTGHKTRIERASVSAKVRIVERDDALTWDSKLGAGFGISNMVDPIVTINDRVSTRLGSNSANKTVWAVKRMPDWTSVVFGTARVPAYLLRNLIKASNCHVYAAGGQDVVVWADARLLAVRSRAEGKVTISLPGEHTVTDLSSGQEIARGVSQFDVLCAPGVTQIFQLRPHATSARQASAAAVAE